MVVKRTWEIPGFINKHKKMNDITIWTFYNEPNLVRTSIVVPISDLPNPTHRSKWICKIETRIHIQHVLVCET